jgi:EmrB/QacA subfamily drug resistance transporter
MTTSSLTSHSSVDRAAVQPPGHRRWLALALLATAQFMVVLDASIVNIALPDIGKGLHLQAASLAWIITVYLVAFGALLPLGGRLADLLGRRRMFIIGIAVFSATSLADGLAPAAAALIAARAVQGVGAGLVAPAALSLVTSTFPEGSERTKALSIWGAVAAGGGAAGVLLGGLLTGGLGWRAVFLINVPIGAAVLALTRALVAESRADHGRRLTASRFDLPGAVTVTAGLVALVTALSEAPEWGWQSGPVLSLLAAAAVLLAAFVLAELRGRFPLVPLRLLGVRTVGAGNSIMILTGAAMLGLFYFLSLYEQVILGYGPVTAGLSQLPLAFALIVAAGLAGPLMARLGSRTVLAAGLALLAAGLAWLGTAPTSGAFLSSVLGPSLLVGIGLGAAFVPITAVAVAGVPAAAAGIAGGLVNTSQQIGGAIGLAALATLASARTHVLGAVPAVTALTSGYDWAFRGAALIVTAATLLTLLIVRGKDGAGAAGAH